MTKSGRQAADRLHGPASMATHLIVGREVAPRVQLKRLIVALSTVVGMALLRDKLTRPLSAMAVTMGGRVKYPDGKLMATVELTADAAMKMEAALFGN